MLLPDDVEDGFLCDEKHVFDALHAEHLVGIESLHANDGVVALMVVKHGFRKVLENVGTV